MPRQRVFISSVMRDFEAERAAVQRAVESLRQEPIMAETFGAKPFSPEVACIEGIRNSDIYIGVLGVRYGYVTKEGVSVTEAEFLEARKRGLQILLFEQEIEKQDQQVAFLQRIKGFDDGYFVDSFTTPDELALKVVRALNDLISQPQVTVLDQAGASAHLAKYRWGSRQPPQFGTWLGGVLFPARQGEDLVSEVELGRKEVQDRLVQPALFGAGAIFQLESGVHRLEGQGYLGVEQRDEHGQSTRILTVHTNGTLVYGLALGWSRRRESSILRHHVIDQDEVRQALEAFVEYAGQFYRNLPRGETISRLYLGVSLTGISRRMFGRLPVVEPNSVSIPMHQMNDPLYVPQQPLQLARADLGRANRAAEHLTDLIARAFRIGHAYYLGK